ncbi:MAG: CvpA family protein, partial [Rudaea sp.]
MASHAKAEGEAGMPIGRNTKDGCLLGFCPEHRRRATYCLESGRAQQLYRPLRMNIADIVILALLALSVLFGLMRGFVAEVISLTCWIAA